MFYVLQCIIRFVPTSIIFNKRSRLSQIRFWLSGLPFFILFQLIFHYFAISLFFSCQPLVREAFNVYGRPRSQRLLYLFLSGQRDFRIAVLMSEKIQDSLETSSAYAAS